MYNRKLFSKMTISGTKHRINFHMEMGCPKSSGPFLAASECFGLHNWGCTWNGLIFSTQCPEPQTKANPSAAPLFFMCSLPWTLDL